MGRGVFCKQMETVPSWGLQMVGGQDFVYRLVFCTSVTGRWNEPEEVNGGIIILWIHMTSRENDTCVGGGSWVKLAAMLSNSDDLSISAQVRSLRGKGRSKLWTRPVFALSQKRKSETKPSEMGEMNGVNISNYSYFSHVFSNSWPKALFSRSGWGHILTPSTSGAPRVRPMQDLCLIQCMCMETHGRRPADPAPAHDQAVGKNYEII